jgi:hypothetical protein
MQVIPPALSAGEWHMVTWRHSSIAGEPKDGVYFTACKIDVFYDGVLQDCLHYDTDSVSENDWGNTASILSNWDGAAQDLDIGWYEDGDEFINSATKVGAILVYEAGDLCLPNSAVWSNYLATKTGVGIGARTGITWSYK